MWFMGGLEILCSSLAKRPLLALVFLYLLLAFCYPPLPLGPLVFGVWALVWYVSDVLTPRQAFKAHFLGGIFFNLISYYWIALVIKVGPLGVVLAGLGLLTLFFSLLNGYIGYLYAVLAPKKWGLSLFILAYTGFEVLRSLGQMSFPWMHLGYTLGHHPRYMQIGALGGIFGLTLLILIVNGFVYIFIKSKKVKYFLLALLILASSYGWGFLRLQRFDQIPATDSIRITLVQPSVEQTKKWDEDYYNQVLQQTYSLLGKDKLPASDLVVLPETAIPAFLNNRPAEIETFSDMVQSHQSYFLLGSLDFQANTSTEIPYRYFNSAFLFAPHSNTVLKYDKVRLVPFSEKLPFDNVFPLLTFVNLGQANFSAGPGAVVWNLPVPFQPSICYEVVYPDFFREARKQGAKLFVNITNDGWFGRSLGPYQHANISRFRAVENGIPLARCANSGISLFADACGRVTQKTSLLTREVLFSKLELKSLSTLYTQFGAYIDAFFLFCWSGVQGLLILGFIKKKVQKSSGTFRFTRKYHSPR